MSGCSDQNMTKKTCTAFFFINRDFERAQQASYGADDRIRLFILNLTVIHWYNTMRVFLINAGNDLTVSLP